VITINFAGRNYRFLSRLYAGFAVTGCVLALLLAAQAWGLFTVRAGIASMESRLALQMARDERIMPVLQERERIVRDLTNMAGLVEARRFSWTRLLTSMESAFPVGAAVTKFEYHPGERSLVLEGVARSPEALRDLMVGLEKSRAFKDPLLKHQSVDKGSISFNVVTLYTDHITPGLAR